MRKINEIIIHCAATKPDMDIGVKEIDRWHRARGFFGVGYHYVIRRSGALEHGRDIEKAGAHAEGHNANSIGICMAGGIDSAGRPKNNFTDAQWDTLKDLVTKLIAQYGAVKIIGHNQISHKSCPCFSVPKWLSGGMNKI